jgi:hypothetical protein
MSTSMSMSSEAGRPLRTAAAAILAVALSLAGSGCGQDLTVTPVRNLERPADLEFLCMGLVPRSETDPTVVASGLPMSACHDPATGAVVGDGGVAGLHATFGLLTNSARAEVGAIDWGNRRLVDLDRRVPGYNMVPVGAQPEVLSVSTDGCLTVTANRGSCDLSLIDNSQLLAGELGARPATEMTSVVAQVLIRTGGGAILGAAPGEIAFVPPLSQPPPPPPPADAGADVPPDGGAADAPAPGPDAPAARLDAAADAGATGGSDLAAAQPFQSPALAYQAPVRACSAAPQRAIVTFPSCDLIAMVDLPSGQIAASFRVMADGSLVDTGTSPSCRAECAPGASTGGDAGTSPAAADAGGGPGAAASLGLSALAISPEDNRVYVGATRVPVIVTLGLNEQGLFALPGGGRIELADNPRGVDRLRLSREPGRARAGRGAFVGERGRFLYAFARDGSVRVVMVGGEATRADDPIQVAVPTECDVNVDPAFASLANQVDRHCFPVALGRPRSPLANGPGLRLPMPGDGSEVSPPIAIDISFSESGTGAAFVATGYLLASDGFIYHVALDSRSMMRVEATNTLRRDPSRGPPALSGAPVRSFGTTAVPYPAKVVFPSTFNGPRLEGFTPANLETFLYFPRPDSVPFGGLGLRWEGPLPDTARVTGQLRPGEVAGEIATLADVGADFCSSGVEPGDVVTMLGCQTDQDCSSERQETCYRAAAGAPGACLPRRVVEDDNLIRLCQPELTSRRRYQVRRVWKNRVTIGLKLDEVPRPSIRPCVPNSTVAADIAICQPDASHRPDPTLAAMGDVGFQCLDLGDGGMPRCLKPCGVKDQAGRLIPSDQLCRVGHVCVDTGDQRVGPLCMEAPPPRSQCSGGDIRYAVQAGQGFTVTFDALPFFSRVRADPNTGACIADPDRHPLAVSRIPLAAPRCLKLPDPRDEAIQTNDVMSASFRMDELDSNGRPINPNPCLYEAVNLDGPRPLNREDPGVAVKAVFENPYARLVLTNLQDYVGDVAAIDAQIAEGFAPLLVGNPTSSSVRISLGVRIVSGPMQSLRLAEADISPPPAYVFVVDQGRTAQLLSRGQIVLVNPRPLSAYPGGVIEPSSTGSQFPIQ